MATRLNLMDYSVWDVDDVSTWLGQIHLSQLVPNFERLGIMGADLPRLSDQYIRDKLKITKPAEVMALRGAISHLVDSAQQKNQVQNRSATRKVSGSQVSKSPQPLPARRSSLEDKKKLRYNTLPTEKIVLSKQPQLKDSPAPVLLDEHLRHSGWIRKQGGGHKNWRRRYLILRRGCLYYFTNETASQAKGSFMLTGYKAEECIDPKIVERFKHTLKLTPMNPAVRTYYMAVGSRRELESWLQAIKEEIAICQERTRVSVVPAVYDDDEDQDDMDPSGDPHVYDDPNPENPYEAMGLDGTDVIYDEPPEEHDDDDDDDPYCHIDEHLSSPTHLKDPKGLLPTPGDGGIPIVPERSDISLRLREESELKKKPLASSVSDGATAANGEMQEDTYLKILGAGSEPIMPPPVAQDEQPPVIQRGGFEIPLPRRTEPDPSKDIDYEDADGGEEDGNSYNDEDDPYYILFRTPDELMPSSCIFDVLERPEADRLLRAKNRDGTYLIRGGAHAGAENVLSVWQIDRCRHYKLFKDDNNGYFSLTQGQSFKTIPELIQYYSKQAQLPRSDFYLGDPYHPDDH